MFNKTDINGYRQIKAPAELKSSVLTDACAAPKKNGILDLKVIYGVAACLALVIICSVFMNTPLQPATVSVASGEHSVLAASSRSMTIASLNIEAEGRIIIEKISEGFYLSNEKGELTELDKKANAKNEITLYWLISESSAKVKINNEVYNVKCSEDGAKITVEK